MSHAHLSAQGEGSWSGLMGTIKGEAGGGRGCTERCPFRRNTNPARAAQETIHFQDRAKEKALVVVSITRNIQNQSLLLSKANRFGQDSHTSVEKQSA